MNQVTKSHLRFNPEMDKDFAGLLKDRVNQYFKEKQISRYANTEMVVKTIFMLSLYILPFVAMLTLAMPWWAYLLMSVVMGVGMAGIGLAVMHDANHGAYSRNKTVNDLVGRSLNLLGGNITNWKIQHNVKHHTYTNIDGHDEDIAPKGGLIRLCPHSELKRRHRYQFIYAWPLYGLMTFTWILMKDIRQHLEYSREGLLAKYGGITMSWIKLLSTKIIYLAILFGLPLWLTPFSFGMVFLGFFLMHYTGGLILALVFQPAHVMEDNEYPLPEGGTVENNWSVHQLHTTCNFAPNNKLLSWYVGGLNYQVEHHLFPNICHVHYRHLSRIVQQTASEFGLPYKSYRSFRAALKYHGQMLYVLGRKQLEPAMA